jgi:hypothetical protein
MKLRRPDPECAPPWEANRDRRARLVVALHNAGPDLEAGAARFAAHDDETTGGIDRVDDTRTVLLTRLYRRSGDFAATTALKALDTFTAGVRADTPSSAPDRLRCEGLSYSERARRWLHISGAA